MTCPPVDMPVSNLAMPFNAGAKFEIAEATILPCQTLLQTPTALLPVAPCPSIPFLHRGSTIAFNECTVIGWSAGLAADPIDRLAKLSVRFGV